MTHADRNRLRFVERALVALVVLGASGCASVPRPDAQLVRSETAIRQAIEVGAREHAPLQLRTAETKLQQAHAAVTARDNDKARRLAEQAELDAKVAELTTLADKSQRSVDELNKSIELLRRELGLSPKSP